MTRDTATCPPPGGGGLAAEPQREHDLVAVLAGLHVPGHIQTVETVIACRYRLDNKMFLDIDIGQIL